MPHNSHSSHSRHGGSSSDDLGSTDEVKIFKDEGDREEEKISSENLLEEKSSLIDLTESEEKSGKLPTRPDLSPVFSKLESHASSFNMGYLVSPYSYSNGGAGGLPVTMANKIGLSPFFCHNGDPLTTPPPAHCGIPPYQLDPKAMGLTRPAIYSFPSSQYAYPMLGPDMTPSWHTPSVYSAASSFRSPYPSSLPINPTLSSDFPFRFPPNLLPSVHTSPHHVLNSHPAIVTSGSKQDCNQEPTTNHRYSRNLDSKISTANPQGNECKDNSNEKKKPHIKKPLNAFMLYMKEMRAKVVAECTLKESAAINQILGRRWHALGRDEQAKYYELARRERQLHMQMYPDWSSRTNTSRGKKRKRKQDTNDGGGGGNNMKKCRARFGLDQQNQWCKPCRRKKKCIRYMEGLRGSAGISGTKDDSFQDLDDLDDNASDENLGSPGSIDDNNKTPDDDTGSLNHSLSSPGCQSGLSSLQSPSTSMASPLNLLPSPATPSTIGLPFGLTDNQQDQNVQSQQQLQQPNSGIDSAAQQIRMQQSSQHQIHLSQHQHLLQQHQPHPHTTSSHNGIYEHAGRSFICSGSIGVGRSTIISPSLSNKSSSGICISSSNTLINTSSSASGVTTTAAFTERTMRSLLNPSPSGLLLNNNCFPPSGLESSAGAIISIEHILSNANKISSGTASNTTTTNTVGKRANDDLNGFISFNNNSDPSFTNNTGNNSACENNSMAVTSTPLVSDTVKPLPAAMAKSSVSSSAPSSPVGDTFEKAVAPAQRNPIGANPHDINNPLSINQLTKCSESTSNTNKNIVTTTNNNFKNIIATADKNSNSSCFDNISTASSSNTNGIAAKKYNHNNQQLPKQLALRISSTASSPQQQQLATTCLFPPVPQHYQQQFHLHTSTGQPTPPTHHHASLRHSHAHPPLFNQHFQQFSHHLASVAAAAAATNVHIPNILSAAVVKPNNSMQRNTTSDVIANEAAAPTIIEAIETTAEDKACTESVGNLTALKCHASETTVATTTSMPGTTTVTTKTLPVLAADNTPLLNVNTTASGNENGAISVT
ncbi:protein pangolin, isoforms A/H/I/S isoform X6 [Bactrocera tryoni]|uniref:protein pangolin, isoforms A/H/I/S isoform X6 n=1 Tax=Bactrocera tryoni TaxID=59916 RepID=UPI001A9788F1|nr:protein pangolin, isoforms A/H/I/S isoform X6 [Bactrocera tryoni]